jgi:LPXTG-motif cell wall-anchored protein
MKKPTFVPLIIGGLLLAGGAAVHAGDINPMYPEPTLVVSPTSGVPGFEYTLVVEPCGEESFTVDFEGPNESETVPCGSGNMAMVSFTAPMTPGVYDVSAEVRYLVNGIIVLDDHLAAPCSETFDSGGFPFPCSLTATITVLEPEATTTTTMAVDETTTTAVDETTTTAVDETTTTLDDSGVPVPTTAPTGTLPATGSTSSSVPVSLALMTLLAGVALLAVTRARRSA